MWLHTQLEGDECSPGAILRARPITIAGDEEYNGEGRGEKVNELKEFMREHGTDRGSSFDELPGIYRCSYSSFLNSHILTTFLPKNYMIRQNPDLYPTFNLLTQGRRLKFTKKFNKSLRAKVLSYYPV